MKKLVKNKMIPNWTHFGIQHAIVEVWRHKHKTDEGSFDIVYNGFITLFLENDLIVKSNNEEDDLVISLQTDVFDIDMYECAGECARQVVNIFGKVSKTVYVLDSETSKIIEDFELDEDVFLEDGEISLIQTDDNEDENSNEPEFDEFKNVTYIFPKSKTVH